MARPESTPSAVSPAVLMADFVIPATVDMMIAAIEADTVNIHNFDEALAKVGRALYDAALKTVTPDMEPYVQREDGIPMPQVLPVVHQTRTDAMGDMYSYAIDQQSNGAPVTNVMDYRPNPTVASIDLEHVGARPPSKVAVVGRVQPVQESAGPSLVPTYNRRKTDRVAKKADAPRIAPLPEPKTKLPRGINSVNETVRFDVIICLEDGKKVADLGKHLAEKGITPAAYRKKWGLSPNYPMRSPKLVTTRGTLRQYQPSTGTYVPVR